MTLAELSRLPTYVLFARSARYAMREAVKADRLAAESIDWWFPDFYRAKARRLRECAWDHLKAAREAKRSLAT